MPRTPKSTKLESEMSPLEIADSKLSTAVAAFKKKASAVNQKAVIDATDLYRGAMLSELG